MDKKAFNKENAPELFSQLVKVLSREKDRGKVEQLIKDLKSLSSKVFVELKKPKYAKEEKMDKIAKLVESIYYYDKPKVYRPNFKELDTQLFNCPKCKCKLSLPRQRSIKLLYVCPSCSFKIPHEQVLNSREQVEEYMAETKKKKEEAIVSKILEEAGIKKNAGIVPYLRKKKRTEITRTRKHKGYTIKFYPHDDSKETEVRLKGKKKIEWSGKSIKDAIKWIDKRLNNG